MDAFMFIKIRAEEEETYIQYDFFLFAKNIIYDSATEKKCVLYEMNQNRIFKLNLGLQKKNL